MKKLTRVGRGKAIIKLDEGYMGILYYVGNLSINLKLFSNLKEVYLNILKSKYLEYYLISIGHTHLEEYA